MFKATIAVVLTFGGLADVRDSNSQRSMEDFYKSTSFDEKILEGCLFDVTKDINKISAVDPKNKGILFNMLPKEAQNIVKV